MKRLIGAVISVLMAGTMLVAFSATPAHAISCDYTDANLQYACVVFLDFNGHLFDTDEASYWAGVGQSYGHYVEVNGLLYSAEVDSRYIGDLYNDVLGRDPDSQGLFFWSTSLQQQKLSLEQVTSLFLASDEGFAELGGTNDDFTTELYSRWLSRAPESQAALDYWSTVIAQYGRYAVSMYFATSPESTQKAVMSLYDEYLGRDADSGGLSYWSHYMANAGKLATTNAIAGSNEAFTFLTD